jgi:hypothetical protein
VKISQTLIRGKESPDPDGCSHARCSKNLNPNEVFHSLVKVKDAPATNILDFTKTAAYLDENQLIMS